ncbi:MAG: WXG100 family type VII secretion target [Microbacterium sp.]|uniref:WXG100 family type VII secretion target n=1 Tax=Microbacterium sp. TaxID=51671 RepID=UPI0026350122|nr:WXG100 family type VII secretion target [Microbacterium sp.]MCX6501164.1 WXG100 family type VII secretion target [Microbacterium sp.]
MDHLEVTPARLKTAADAIEKAAAAIDDEVSGISTAADVLRAQWSGDAQVAFDTAQERFTALMESRSALVRMICTALEQLAVGYSTLDLEAARALGASA